MLYNEEQRTLLKKAAAVLSRAGMKQSSMPDPAVETLRKAIYTHKKDFAAIKKQTDDLE